MSVDCIPETMAAKAAPKAAKAKVAPKATVDKAKEKAKAKAKAKVVNEEAVEVKKEQQNFVNCLKYRANQCKSTEAQELLKAHWGIVGQ